MILVNYTEFRTHMKKYLELAITEKVILQNKGMAFEIVPSSEIKINPSPSGDKYWEVPENIERLKQDLEELKTADKSSFKSWDSLKDELGL